MILSLAAVAFLLIHIFNLSVRIRKELEEFSEAVKYRDFTRSYNERNAPAELKPLRKSFSEINRVFKALVFEKETHHLYLQKTMSMIDTAIMSYEEETGAVSWMNEPFTRLLDIPYLRTIHALEKKYPSLYTGISALRFSDNRVVSTDSSKGAQKLLLSAASFRSDGKLYKVVALQNINTVLDENEANAWSRLLGVMTHEIMNSVAPISSLAETISGKLKSEAEDGAPLHEDLALGIETIKRRSDGLLRFAETYHKLSKLSRLNLAPVRLAELFEDVSRLMEPMLEQRGIALQIFLRDPSLGVSADRSLLEQVIINLILNAMEALRETGNPCVGLAAEEAEDKKVLVRVADNGKGIAPEALDNIFIPFYTTKKNGSGIGLSLCKQIMLMHRGTITVRSSNQGTVFELGFRAG